MERKKQSTSTSGMSRQIANETERTVDRAKKSVMPQELIHTGSTMLNLACSDHWRGGFQMGTIVTQPGASAGGKTMLAMTAMAECIHDERFKNYEFIFDDSEAALNFDMEYLFGKKVADAIKDPPLGTSRTVQDFKANILTIMNKQKKSCIYILDSLDSLSSDEEMDKEMRRAVAAAKSKEAADAIAGSYGMEKAKNLHQILRMVNTEIEKTNSLLIILQQLKQKTDATMYGPKMYTTGGEGPFFYSSHRTWLKKFGAIKREGIEVGGYTEAFVEKNKLTGKRRKVNFPIYEDYGVDDIGSILDWLVEWGFLKKTARSGKDYDLKEFDLIGSRPKTTGVLGTLVTLIEDAGLETELRKYVWKCWKEVEEGLRQPRKPRFN